MSGLNDELQNGLWLFQWPPDSAVSLLALKCLFRGTGLLGQEAPASAGLREDQDNRGHSQHLYAGLCHSFC